MDYVPKKSGIYYFFDEHDRLIYIGKSYDLRNRVLQHLRENEKEVKNLFFSLCSKKALDEIESLMIDDLKPIKNKKRESGKFTYKGFYFDDDILAVINAYEGNKSEFVSECIKGVFREKGLLE